MTKYYLGMGGEIKVIKKFIAGLTVGTLVLNVASISLVEASFGGKPSYGKKKKSGISISCKTKLQQTSVTDAYVDIHQKANTGDNDIKGTTGNGALIDTGNVDQYAKVKISGGSNFAVLPCGCGCDRGVGLPGVELVPNGHGPNHVNVNKDSSLYVHQTSVTDVDVDIHQKANTGDNDIKGSTSKKKYHGGGGDGAEILTGDVNQTAKVYVSGGSNAVVGDGQLLP